METTTTIVVPTWALLTLLVYLFLDWGLDIAKEILKNKIKTIDREIIKIQRDILEKGYGRDN